MSVGEDDEVQRGALRVLQDRPEQRGHVGEDLVRHGAVAILLEGGDHQDVDVDILWGAGDATQLNLMGNTMEPEIEREF